MNHVELHLHTHYSPLDGYSTPAEYASRAKELGMTHLAVTDHGTLSSHREFQRATADAGITPILGMEAYFSATDRFDRRSSANRADGDSVYNHLSVLSVNETGLSNLNTLSKLAWTEGFYHKPRIDMELLEEYNEGLVVMSGCMSGIIPRHIMANDYDAAKRAAEKFKSFLGDRFFIEVMGANDIELNAGLMRLASDTGIRPVVTSDCHHANKSDLWAQEAFLILSTKPKHFKDFDMGESQKKEMLDRLNYLYPDRRMTFQEFGLHLNSYEEHIANLERHGIGTEPVDNTNLIAAMVEPYPYHKNLDLLPSPDITITDLDAELKRLVFKGLAERGFADNQEYVDRAEHELEVIKIKGFATYFLILADVIDWARAQGIFIGPGRGSGVSSLVNYCLHITNIDPIPYKLLFFRFLDPDRDDWPDIDVDFEVKRRYEVKEYVSRKYGHTANIMTFNYFRGKSAIKAAASVFKISPSEVNKATATLSDDAESSAMEKYETSEATAEFRRKYPEVLTLAKALDGRIKGTGMHAGGTIMSKVPIEDYVPIQTATDPQDDAKDRVPVVAVDMRDAAEIGLIKYDFLGLNNLTVILETIESVYQRTGEKIDPYDLTLDDPEVFAMLSQGHTKAVFQCEGGPYTKMLINMGGVQNFEDLISSNALVRPGAANSSIGKNYIKGKETGEYSFVHPSTKYFTEETYGQFLFQEQQMLLCTELAGMTMREANLVRQAIGKKQADKLAVWKPAFIEGASQRVSQAKAESIWEDLEKSAEYAFNRAHSVGYSMISYWTAWFKLHYPVEYMTATLNHLSGSDTKTKALFYLMESKRMGLDVRLPHVNTSEVDNTVDNGAIRMGLSSIKYISGKVGHKIVEQAPYASYEQLLATSKTKGSGINSRAIDSLNKIGAAAFDDNPRTGRERENFYEFLNIPAFESQDLSPHVKTQFRGLDEYAEDDTFIVCAMVYNVKGGKGWALVEMVDESGSAGCFADQNIQVEKGKMYVFLISNNRIARFVTTDDIINGEGGSLSKYLDKERLDLKEGQYRCLSFNTRTTKAGGKLGQAVFTDADKNLTGCMVFNTMLDAATVPCITSAKCRPEFAETRSGGVYLKSIN